MINNLINFLIEFMIISLLHFGATRKIEYVMSIIGIKEHAHNKIQA